MAQTIISHIKFVLYDMAFLDIRRASTGDSKIGAFILSSCFIDCMAGFVCGGKSHQKDYESFVRQYLPGYDPTNLYEDLRCRLVHNYSEGGSYWLTYNHPELHGQTVDKRTFINLENFVDDLEVALDKFVKHIESDLSAEKKATDRYNSIGLLCPGGLAPGKA
jgi:hypothetical protein